MTNIALLRAINLPSHGKVTMADLRAFMEALGFGGCQSLLQTGNLVFDGGARSPAKLEQLLETEAKKRLELETEFFVRTAAEWRKMIDANPFPKEAVSDPAHLVAVALKGAPAAARVKALQQAIVGREMVKAVDRTAYIVFPDGIGRSKLTHAMIEKHLGTRGSGRNWNTIRKLSALAC
jgi:uncharacterized protein (DUF1697 family)